MKTKAAKAPQPPEVGPFAVFFRPNVKGARWRKIGQAPTRLRALYLMKGSGEWRIAAMNAAALVGTLFEGYGDDEK